MVLSINRFDSVKLIVRGELYGIDIDTNGTCEFTVSLPCTTTWHCTKEGNECDYRDYVERVGSRRYKVTQMIQTSIH